MRTSHRQIRKRILDAKSKITDEEFFSSRAYNGYLTDLAEAANKTLYSVRCVCESLQIMMMRPLPLRITTESTSMPVTTSPGAFLQAPSFHESRRPERA